jgi:hypothetical protein
MNAEPTQAEQRAVSLLQGIANDYDWYLKHPEDAARHIDMIEAAWRDMARIRTLAYEAQRGERRVA